MSLIIGFGHRARAGKDTAAEALCRDLGFRRMGFADQVKELALECDPLVTSYTRTVNTQIGHGKLKWVVTGMGGWETAKDSHPEVRIFLQNLGLGARRVFGDDFWIDQVLSKIGPEDRVVIPDVRFENEAEAIKAAGGYVIDIHRPSNTHRDTHPSETELDDYEFDEVFTNATSIMDLQATVVAYVKNLIQVKEKAKPATLPLDLDVVLHEAGVTA